MMNSDVAIAVRDLSKRYTLRTRRQSPRITLGLFGKSPRPRASRQFFALSNVSFSVERGEGLAVFGTNGSGKTTLLQLLANVMTPTNGTVTVNGRHTAVLGATLGMMPRLTGLENVHLMGAMYGIQLGREKDLLDEIIAFADIGEFMNSYVKNLSGGMIARIGFSVAIHAFPEIVFIDEVLRVGDVHFKEKCDLKIQQMRESGRTFVIVTQNVRNVEDLCQRAIWLDSGQLILDGPVQDTWKEYRSFWLVERRLRNPS